MKMAVNKTLLTEIEAINFTPIAKNFPPCDLRELRKSERQEFRECLGKAFYDALLADLADYSAKPKYEGGVTYNLNDVVKFEGLFYIVIVATTDKIPTTVTDWALAPKFTTECYNDLWCEALGEYLSWVLLKNKLPYISTKVTGQGVVRPLGAGFMPAESSEVKRLQIAINRDIAICFEELNDYMISNNTDGCFGLYIGIGTDCCNSCGCLEKSCQCDNPCLKAKKTKNRYNVG